MKIPRKLKKSLKKRGMWMFYKAYSLIYEDFYKNYEFPQIMQGQDETSDDYRKRVLEYVKENWK